MTDMMNYKNPKNKISLFEGSYEFEKIQTELQKKIDAKINEAWKQEQLQVEKDRIDIIKSLLVDAPLFYIGNWKKLIGIPGKKVRDGRTRIVVDFGEAGKWNCRYKEISSIEPTKQDIAGKIASINVIERINSIRNE